MHPLKHLFFIAVVAVGGFSVVAPAAFACGVDKPTPAKTKQATNPANVVIPVHGMTCDGCANKVQVMLMKIQGVLAANVVFKTNHAAVYYDAALVTTAEIVDAIKRSGYKAGVPKPVKVPSRKG